MPRAEIGSTKHQSNLLKAKGLGRLRWYCTPCAKQCRDENGFRCHVKSESHVRKMETLREDFPGVLQDNSSQFASAFTHLLRTSHGEKPVHINRFYQTYIADPHHVHLNATCWPSLTAFGKHLGREGICRVEEKDDGFWIAWIDTSLGALKRKEAIAKDQQKLSEEKREQRLLEDQVIKAREQELAKTRNRTDGRASNSDTEEPISAGGEQLPTATSISFKIGTVQANSDGHAARPKSANNVFRARKRSKKDADSIDSDRKKEPGASQVGSGNKRKKIRAEL